MTELLSNYITCFSTKENVILEPKSRMMLQVRFLDFFIYIYLRLRDMMIGSASYSAGRKEDKKVT